MNATTITNAIETINTRIDGLNLEIGRMSRTNNNPVGIQDRRNLIDSYISQRSALRTQLAIVEASSLLTILEDSGSPEPDGMGTDGMETVVNPPSVKSLPKRYMERLSLKSLEQLERLYSQTHNPAYAMALETLVAKVLRTRREAELAKAWN